MLKGTIHEAEVHRLGWIRLGEKDAFGRRGGLRLGQYLWNMLGEGTWPELFYCEDSEKAMNMIREYYYART